MSKTTERAVVNQLFAHCESCALLPTNQSAYRKFHSTETALLRVQGDEYGHTWAWTGTRLALINLPDLRAAFHTIDYGILLDILGHDFGIIGNVKERIKSFLCKRHQHVLVEQRSPSLPTWLRCPARKLPRTSSFPSLCVRSVPSGQQASSNSTCLC